MQRRNWRRTLAPAEYKFSASCEDNIIPKLRQHLTVRRMTLGSQTLRKQELLNCFIFRTKSLERCGTYPTKFDNCSSRHSNGIQHHQRTKLMDEYNTTEDFRFTEEHCNWGTDRRQEIYRVFSLIPSDSLAKRTDKSSPCACTHCKLHSSFVGFRFSSRMGNDRMHVQSTTLQ